jgi:hypothetical protein
MTGQGFCAIAETRALRYTDRRSEVSGPGEKTVKIDTETKLCAVIGNPVKHSLSPAMHNAAFQSADLNYVYLAFNVTGVQACVAGMRALPSFRGLSVTIPHKVAVMPYLDEVDALARHVGCVNTITNENGRLVGTSTDGLGTLRVFERAGVSLRGKRVLFIGSGGAVRSVAFAFAERGAPAGVTILGRTPAHVDTLVADLEASSPVPIHARVAFFPPRRVRHGLSPAENTVSRGRGGGGMPHGTRPRDAVGAGHAAIRDLDRGARARRGDARRIACGTRAGA